MELSVIDDRNAALPPWILDLDGVMWLGDTPVPGSVGAVEELRRRGRRVLFVTNNSSSTIADYLAKFVRIGLTVSADDLCTSAQAAARLIEPGQTALVCAGPGVTEALTERGIRAVHDLGGTENDPIDAVVVGFHRDFDFERLRLAHLAVRRGARLIATNDDATYLTPSGPIPGGGAIAAAVSYACGRGPEFAGKPYPASVKLARERLGFAPDEGSTIVMVGDRPSTDGAFARALGSRFALVLSGVTARGDLPVDPSPDFVADDLAALVRLG